MARFRKNFGGDEELEKRYYAALERAKKYAKLIKEGKLMSNQPVAWMEPDVIPLTHIIKAVVRREQDEQYSIPLYTHPVKEQELLDEVTKLKWEINHREQDIDALKTKLNDVKYKYDIKTHQHIYTQVYVDELQAKIKTLKAHPVKELTDEEILEVWDEDCVVLDEDKLVIRFAKAILRKAQEK